jgi:hypothetical protein
MRRLYDWMTVYSSSSPLLPLSRCRRACRAAPPLKISNRVHE